MKKYQYSVKHRPIGWVVIDTRTCQPLAHTPSREAARKIARRLNDGQPVEQLSLFEQPVTA
jgi:hypothetical protein